jgi:hypothetical protein
MGDMSDDREGEAVALDEQRNEPDLVGTYRVVRPARLFGGDPSLPAEPSGRLTSLSDVSWLREIRCRECGCSSFDDRWAPLCPPCYESRRHEQRREHVRPEKLTVQPWADPDQLGSRFEAALGPADP